MTDPRQPRVSNQKGYDLPLGFVAALAVHALLFVGFTFVFQWKTEPESFYAELWAPEDASGQNVDGTQNKKDPEPTPEEIEKAKQAEEERLAQEREAEQARLAEEERLRKQYAFFKFLRAQSSYA